MNGECKSYRLNEPMAWKEFKDMPDDIKCTYVKLLRQKFNVPDKYIAEMLGIGEYTFSGEINRLGISEGKNCRGRCTPWDREGYYAWWHGADKPSEPTQEEKVHWVEPESVNTEEPEAFLEDDIPFEEPDPVRACRLEPYFPETATPCNGSMQFNCPANQALNMLAQVLGNTNCAISVMWRVTEEGNGGNE